MTIYMLDKFFAVSADMIIFINFLALLKSLYTEELLRFFLSGIIR